MSRHRTGRSRPRPRRRGRLAVVALVLTALPVGIGALAVDVLGPAALVSGVDAVVDVPRSRPATSVALSEPVLVRDATQLPERSGGGRRVVFSESRQRVWLVRDGDRVARTYEVSGSIYDNLSPGTYEVFSRSEDAVGIDDSGTMRWFVRFTRGDRGAAIGFHSIPMKDGKPVQTHDELGTPLSHGCIRQRRSDARAMWDFAPLGTTVVVTP